MDGRHQRARSTAADPEGGRAAVTAARWSGAATSLTGTLIAVITFPTVSLKVVGAVVCLLIGATILTTARVRDRPAPRVLLSLSLVSVAALALVIVLGSQDAPAEPTSPRAAPGSSATTAGTIGTAQATPPPPPGAVSLVDLGPVRGDPARNLWTSGPTRLAGVPHDKAVAATGAWCGSNQVEYALDGRFARFQALVGIADESAETKPLHFFALADGNRVVDFPVVQSRTPRAVDVPVAGVTRLVIGVQPPAGDPSNCPGPERVGVWADPLLVPAG
ncbi:NPCBM/NEW2 domain-containing protein [Actinosynnema sp. NPDC050436]|uniref:NPCBM/NEW2 domain-containing protein n=1 Tax=Actinosynnema sp. NPDC050436 TaxID=3155659 RepID=UPI0033D88A76